MDFVNIGHDCILGDYIILATGARIAGYVKINDSVTIGMNTCIRNRKEIPRNVKIGMGSVVTKSCELWTGGTFAGNPCAFIPE